MVAKEIQKQIQSVEKIGIIVHKSPDGDAIGAAVGLKRVLRNCGKDVSVIVPDAAAENLLWMEDAQDFCNAENNWTRTEEHLEAADLLFCLDFNAFHRAGKALDEYLKQNQTPKIMIDHHPNPDTESFEQVYSNVAACSTAELVAQLVYEWQVEEHLDLVAMEALYMGVVTDSGSFRYPSVSSLTHQMVAKMIDQGLEPYKVHERIFDNNSENQVKLKAYTISEKLEIQDQLAILSLTQEELQKYNYQKGDTEGLVNTGLSIKGVKMSVFFKEKEGGGVKISFRSKGEVYVNQLASDHFDGGGHQYAAGGFFEGNISDAIALLKEKVSDYVE